MIRSYPTTRSCSSDPHVSMSGVDVGRKNVYYSEASSPHLRQKIQKVNLCSQSHTAQSLPASPTLHNIYTTVLTNQHSITVYILLLHYNSSIYVHLIDNFIHLNLNYKFRVSNLKLSLWSFRILLYYTGFNLQPRRHDVK